MSSFLSNLLSFLSPRQCPACGKRVEAGSPAVCAACDMQLPRTGYVSSPYDNPMARLYWGRIPIEKASALIFYQAGDNAVKLVYDMKYHDRPDYCYAMGQFMATELSSYGFFDDIDIIVPVPLAPLRLAQRGYNQSLEMARGISDCLHLPISTKAVVRTRFNQSQTHLDRMGRLDNMDGIWQLANADEVKHRHVLIVDDVVTTGATTISCAKELLKVDGVKVSVLSLAFALH